MSTVTLKTLVDAQQSIEDLLESQKNLILELTKNNNKSVADYFNQVRAMRDKAVAASCNLGFATLIHLNHRLEIDTKIEKEWSESQ